jgi:hypothetical protein
MAAYFNPEQIALARQSFADAETIARRCFRLGENGKGLGRYDVKTKAQLETHEICEGRFAHLFRYEYSSDKARECDRSISFYCICLQDDVILDAVKRAGRFVRLSPLLLYVAAHELVHVIRFEQGEGDFYAAENERMREEEKVHQITRSMLKPLADNGMDLVLDCFSDQYRVRPFQ